MHKYVDSHLPLGGIYALSPFLFIFFLIARKNIAKTWPRSGEKGDQNTIKNHFSHCSFSIKKKKEESKKERKKEKNRKEKKKA